MYVYVRFGFADYFSHFLLILFWLFGLACAIDFMICVYVGQMSKQADISIWISDQNNDTGSNDNNSDGDDDDDEEEEKSPNLNHSPIFAKKKSHHLICSPTVLFPISTYRCIHFYSIINPIWFMHLVRVFGLIETKSKIDILPKIWNACCLSPLHVECVWHFSIYTHIDISIRMPRTG